MNAPLTEDALVRDFHPAQITQWHHDCSNTTGWVVDPDPPQPLGEHQSVSINSDGSEIYSGSIPSSSSYYHGVRYFYALDTTFSLEDISLTVQIKHPGTSSRMGFSAVGLYDQYKNRTVYVDQVDAWYASSTYNNLGYTDESGFTSHHTSDRSNGWTDTLQVRHNGESGYFEGIDSLGSYNLISDISVDLTREIHYIAISFWNKQSFTYESDRIMDILVQSSVVDETTTTTTTPSAPQDWHDDCTSTSGWKYHTEWDGWSRWDFASGTLASDNGYLHCPTNTGWETGPFWFKEFDTPFTLAEFDSLDVEVETIQPSQSYKGNLRFTIFDDSKNPIFYIAVNSWDELEHAVHISVGYYYADITSTGYASNDMDPDFHGTLDIHYDPSSGLMGTIPGGPGGGSGVILTPAEWASESNRVAKYVGIQWRKGAGIYLDHRVHDISIEVASSTTSSTDGLLPPSLDFTGLLGIGITVGAVAVIIIIGGGIYCRQRGAAPVTSDFTYG